MASMIQIRCKCGCKRQKMVRTADVKRGWGKFYSKSCKAKFQNRTRNKYHNEVRTVDGVEAGPNDVFTDQDHEDCLDSIEGA